MPGPQGAGEDRHMDSLTGPCSPRDSQESSPTPQFKSIKKKIKNQINKIRNEKVEVITDNAEMQRIIRDYYEQLYGNKMDNLEEMDRS